MFFKCVSTAAFHARVRGSVPGLGGLKETKMFLSHPRVKVSIVGSLRDREIACSASDRQGSKFESCVWRTVSCARRWPKARFISFYESSYWWKCSKCHSNSKLKWWPSRPIRSLRYVVYENIGAEPDIVHSKQYRFFRKNLSALLPCNPRRTLQRFSWGCMVLVRKGSF